MMIKLLLLSMIKFSPRVVMIELCYRLLCEVIRGLLNILGLLCYLFLCDIKISPLEILVELRNLLLRNVVCSFVLVIFMVACSNARYTGTEPKKT